MALLDRIDNNFGNINQKLVSKLSLPSLFLSSGVCDVRTSVLFVIVMWAVKCDLRV